MTFLPLLPLDQPHVFAVLWAPELDAALQMGPPRNRAEGDNSLPHSLTAPPSFDAAQDTFPVLLFLLFVFNYYYLHI